ncbi:carbohydrate ABC transporter permease [Sediminibacillus halophilus]|uniref:Multiple sugar transport system permease protein n=1 Tax=Sediminibacillus halophilus TaxID=482461 RepID=A0A1G9RSZ2_9BACI|nr:carbohydrate ABC transporter permease [Sediminibacillus halophilus]SDM26341.1 multiple sugar transport system permease protein [Sediminibacillus halophilus]
MKRTGKKTALIILAAILALLFLIPLAWMISTSFKNDFEAIAGGLNWIPEDFTFENYTYTLLGEGVDVPIFKWMFNSLFAGIAGTAIIVSIDAMAAYGLARLDVPLKKYLFPLFISTLMIPFVITFLPMYMQFSNLGLLNTYAVLIFPYTANAFGVFLLYQFFRSFPKELEEAAHLDGANKWQIFLRVVVPSARPILWTLAIFSFMQIYNDFLWPLVATNTPEMRTITTGIAIMQQGSFVSSYGKLMALTTIATVPILIVFLIGQKQLIKGITQTGIK